MKGQECSGIPRRFFLIDERTPTLLSSTGRLGHCSLEELFWQDQNHKGMVRVVHIHLDDTSMRSARHQGADVAQIS